MSLPYCVITLLCYYPIVSLPYCGITYCVITLLFHYSIVSLPYCVITYCVLTLLCHYPIVLLHYCFITLLCHYPIVLLPYYVITLLCPYPINYSVSKLLKVLIVELSMRVCYLCCSNFKSSFTLEIYLIGYMLHFSVRS